jgi:hypothetical protein
MSTLARAIEIAVTAHKGQVAMARLKELYPEEWPVNGEMRKHVPPG